MFQFKLRTVIRSQFYFKVVLLYIEPFVKEVVQLDMNNLHVRTKDEAKRAKLKTIIKSNSKMYVYLSTSR